MILETTVVSDRLQDGSRRIEVGISHWHDVHHELIAMGFVRFEWLTAVHNLGDDFEIASMVATADFAERIIVTATCSSSTPMTVTDIYAAAQFHEREVRQMFGIQFAGLDEGVAFDAPFDGHPLRRDFALHERAVKPWPGAVEPDVNARRRPALPPGVFTEWSS